MLLTGTYERALDEKQRIPLPKRFRELLREDGHTLYLTPGTDGSLALFTDQSFARLAGKLADQSPTAQDVRAFGRLLYAQTQSVELDGQGRFRVPPELVQFAELGRECVLVGVGDHIELWNRQRWTAYLAAQQPRYDQLAESALSGDTTHQALGAGPSQPAGLAASPFTDEEPVRPAQPR